MVRACGAHAASQAARQAGDGPSGGPRSEGRWWKQIRCIIIRTGRWQAAATASAPYQLRHMGVSVDCSNSGRHVCSQYVLPAAHQLMMLNLHTMKTAAPLALMPAALRSYEWPPKARQPTESASPTIRHPDYPLNGTNSVRPGM